MRTCHCAWCSKPNHGAQVLFLPAGPSGPRGVLGLVLGPPGPPVDILHTGRLLGAALEMGGCVPELLEPTGHAMELWRMRCLASS